MISPQVKLNFLQVLLPTSIDRWQILNSLIAIQVVFDKLNPAFIQQSLERYRWSVETALDDLLTAEDQR